MGTAYEGGKNECPRIPGNNALSKSLNSFADTLGGLRNIVDNTDGFFSDKGGNSLIDVSKVLPKDIQLDKLSLKTLFTDVKKNALGQLGMGSNGSFDLKKVLSKENILGTAGSIVQSKIDPSIMNKMSVIPGLNGEITGKSILSIAEQVKKEGKELSKGGIGSILKKEIEIAKSTAITSSINGIGKNFNLNSYLPTSGETPILTPGKVGNLNNLHNSIVLPITNYTAKNLGGQGAIINKGLSPMNLLTGTADKHGLGQAVDLSIKGIADKVLFDAIKSNPMKIDFGVMSKSSNGGVHITLPYKLEKEQVKGVVLETEMFGTKLSYGRNK
jgi:hypothetical protein